MTRRSFLTTMTLDGLLGRRPGTALLLSVETSQIIAVEHPEVAARTLARPGSTLKPFSLAAALAKGPVAPFPCPGRLTLRDRQMDCSHTPIHHALTVPEAIAYSCNNFVAHAARNLTSQELAEALQRAGLTSHTGLLPHEATGQIQLATDLPGRQLQALGESDILITPLALAVAYRQLARQAPVPIREGLRAAVEFGTAQLADVPVLAISGKTGTAMAPDRSQRQAWFAGFAPAAKPEVVAVVFVPQGSGGGDAAPLARELFVRWSKTR